MISGINYDEITPNMPYDYFFSTAFSIWGWASWRRVIDQWDEHYSFLDDTFNLQQLEEYIKERNTRRNSSSFVVTTGKAEKPIMRVFSMRPCSSTPA